MFTLLFAIVLAALFTIAPPEYPSFPGEEGDWVLVTGKVGYQEYGPGGGILHLTRLIDCSIYNSAEPAQHSTTNPTEYTNEKLPQGVLCYFQDNTLPAPGEGVTVRGRLRPFQTASNPGAFDQAAYYRLQKLELMLQDCVVTARDGRADGYRNMLFELRRRLEARLYETFSQQHASVLSAMLLGSRKSLDREVKQLYQAAGIAHILAISGLHISFLGLGLYKLLRRTGCRAKTAIVICLPVLYSYGILSGAGASGRRAVCMFALQLSAVWFGRTYDMISALSAAALLLLAEQPLYLFDSGFLLSFGAILGIGLLLPALRENLKCFGEGRGHGRVCFHKKAGKTAALQRAFTDSLLASVSVTLATLPVLVQTWYSIPVYAVFLNLLIIPLVGLLLPGGCAALLGNILLPWAAGIPGFFCETILNLCDLLCRLSLTLPGSSLCTGHAENWQILLYYLLLWLAVRYGTRMAAWIPYAGMLAAALLLLWRPAGMPLEIHMVDVGQGDCFLIRAQGTNLLIDAGSSSEKRAGTYQLLPLLQYYGVDRLDYVFVTHLDLDHYSGVLELLEQAATEYGKVWVDRLILPSAVVESEHGRSVLEKMTELAIAEGGSIHIMEAGESVQSGNLFLRCLHPFPGEQVKDSNDTSLVLSLEYKDFRGLFMGDLSVEHEQEVTALLREEAAEMALSNPDSVNIPSYTLLKAGHHGSSSATGDALLREIQPALVLLSYGRNNSYGHPHAGTMARIRGIGAQTFATAECGEVTVKTDGRTVKIECFSLQPQEESAILRTIKQSGEDGTETEDAEH